MWILVHAEEYKTDHGGMLDRGENEESETKEDIVWSFSFENVREYHEQTDAEEQKSPKNASNYFQSYANRLIHQVMIKVTSNLEISWSAL